MLKEFRQFILRGNVVDLAVAVVVGAALTVPLLVVLTSTAVFVSPVLPPTTFLSLFRPRRNQS